MDNNAKFSDIMSIDSVEELSKIIKNPDAFTIDALEWGIESSFLNAADDLKENEELNDGISELRLKNNDDLERLISKMNSSDEDSIREVGEFIESHLQHVENIDLAGKTISSVLWAALIYKYITENKSHMGIFKIDDSFEQVSVATAQSLGLGNIRVADKDYNPSVQDIKNEVLEIFKETTLYEDVCKYFAVSYSISKAWEGEKGKSLWVDFSNLQQIELDENENSIIEDNEGLLNAIRSLDAINFQKAIDYVSTKYCNNENISYIDSEELKYYQALHIVALLSEQLNDNNSPEFKNLKYNLNAKIIAQKNVLDDEISHSNIGVNLTNAKEHALISIKLNAIKLAYKAQEDLGIVDKNIAPEANSVEIEDEEIVENEKQASKIKFGDQKAYIDGYLKLFNVLIKTKQSYYKSLIRKLSQVKSAKAEELVENLAKEFSVQLKTEEDVSNRNLRTVENAKLVAEQVRKQLKELSIIDDIFGKVRRKKKDTLDIENISFDQRMLGDDFYITEESHKIIIREFYHLISGDPNLKSSRETYRLASKNMNMIDLKERAEANPQEYPFFAGPLSMQTISKESQRERIVDKLYVNEDGSLNEDYEDLYNVLTDKDCGIDRKRVAVVEAALDEKLSAEQEQTLLSLLETKKSKATQNSPDQMSMDFDGNANE